MLVKGEGEILKGTFSHIFSELSAVILNKESELKSIQKELEELSDYQVLV